MAHHKGERPAPAIASSEPHQEDGLVGTPDTSQIASTPLLCKPVRCSLSLKSVTLSNCGKGTVTTSR